MKKPTTCSLLALRLAALAGVLVIAACAQRSDHEAFSKPEDAVARLVAAVQKNDVDALRNLFGPGSDAIVVSGDPVADQQAREMFLALYQANHELAPEGDDRAVLQVGPNDWPLPIPLVKHDGRWQFDGKTGADEVVYRRIGRNELGAIGVCHGFVDAQYEYAAEDRDGEGAGIYAQKLMSDPGTHNGLYWETAEDEPPSPVGPFIAQAAAEGYRTGSAAPYHGYRYRPLYRQTANANGGALDYFQNGVLVNGFALLAWPAEYGVSGVMTFIVNQDGVVFQRDLGDDTAALVEQIDAYDPDSSWTAVVDEDVLAGDTTATEATS